jgi:hypothetical protein
MAVLAWLAVLLTISVAGAAVGEEGYRRQCSPTVSCPSDRQGIPPCM